MLQAWQFSGSCTSRHTAAECSVAHTFANLCTLPRQDMPSLFLLHAASVVHFFALLYTCTAL